MTTSGQSGATRFDFLLGPAARAELLELKPQVLRAGSDLAIRNLLVAYLDSQGHGDEAQFTKCLPNLHKAVGLFPCTEPTQCGGTACNGSTCEVQT